MSMDWVFDSLEELPLTILDVDVVLCFCLSLKILISQR